MDNVCSMLENVRSVVNEGAELGHSCLFQSVFITSQALPEADINV